MSLYNLIIIYSYIKSVINIVQLETKLFRIFLINSFDNNNSSYA